jgi:hypothetical protein
VGSEVSADDRRLLDACQLAWPSLGFAHGVDHKRITAITAITNSAGEVPDDYDAINGAACPERVSGMPTALLMRRT